MSNDYLPEVAYIYLTQFNKSSHADVSWGYALARDEFWAGPTTGCPLVAILI